jgi:hypothetical protein
MNTNSEVDRIVSHWLEDRVAEPPHGSLAAALEQAERVPQQRRRLARWFGRGSDKSGASATAGYDARRRIVPAASLAVTGAIALAIVAVLVVPHQRSEPLQPTTTAQTLSVAAEGGDYRTIAAAVAAAQDGDIIRVEPGTYEESLVIDKDITIEGTGNFPFEVVIQAPADAPGPLMALPPKHRDSEAPRLPDVVPVGVQLVDTEATIRHLHVKGQDDGIAVLVAGGAPTLETVTLAHDGELPITVVLAGSLYIEDGSRARIDDVDLWHRVRIGGGSTPTFTKSHLKSAEVEIQDGAAPVFHDSTVSGDCGCATVVVHGGAGGEFTDNHFHIASLRVSGDPEDRVDPVIIEDNQFYNSVRDALSVVDGGAATIVGNDFTGNRQAVYVFEAAADVRDNTFSSNWNGITLSHATGHVQDNSFGGGEYAISIAMGGGPVIRGNTITNAASRGIFAADGTSPTIEGNSICGSKYNLFIAPEAEAVVGDNELCPDGVEPSD